MVQEEIKLPKDLDRKYLFLEFESLHQVLPTRNRASQAPRNFG
jgi:hypothetical protein